MTRQFLKIAATAISVILPFASMASAQEYSFKFHTPGLAQDTVATKILRPWARRVEENSGNRVKIELFPSMSLGGRPSELVQQGRDGVVDLICAVNGYTPGLFPRTEVFELPGVVGQDSRAANLAVNQMFEADSDMQGEYKGLKVMFLTVNPGQGLHMRTKAVHHPDDLAGLKLRIPSRTGAWMIQALGGTPIAMPIPELPSALAKGVVDGTFLPWEFIPALKLEQMTKYQIEGYGGKRFGAAVVQISMNEARWNSLPEDIQQAFLDASGPDWWAQLGKVWQDADEIGIEAARAAGNTHIVMTQEATDEFSKRIEPVVTQWVKEVATQGVDGQKLLETARALIAENGDSE